MKRKKALKSKIKVAILIFCALIFLSTTFIITYGEYVTRFSDVETRINGNTVYINDTMADWYYYKGLNYTESATGTLPTGQNQQLYDKTNLVELEITYKSEDINSKKKGYVSLTEEQDTYIYYKMYPVQDNNTTDTSDDYVEIELIDNPFTNRPNNKGFNGWVTNYQGAIISLDIHYYERHAKIPVTYTDGVPDPITITFNANWIKANITTVNGTTNWNNAFSNLYEKGLRKAEVLEYVYEPYDMTGYFTREDIDFFGSCSNMYNSSGQQQNGNCTCYTWEGCTYYNRIENENYTDSITYYELKNNTMTELDPSTLNFTLISVDWGEDYSEDSIMAGYFRLITVPYNSSLAGYYNQSGTLQTEGTCNTNAGCEYYEMIQYYNSNGEEEKFNEDNEYYYYVSRDTNIIVMTANLSSVWGSNQDKPFTLTAVNNGTDYGSVWTVSNSAVRCYNDTTIENITISTGRTISGTENPSNNNNTARHLYGNNQNLKVGRGIKQSGSYSNFISIVGGSNGAAGSSGNIIKYKLIIESGIYNAISLTGGASTYSNSTSYIEMKGIYGNDYDRVKQDNDSLDVYYCASGSWSGNYYSSKTTGITFDLTVKSGDFGSSEYDYTTGIYVGGRYGGTHYTSRRVKVEGGHIYNLIGGPLTASNRSGYNDTYMYITGGTVDMITGGAGQTATYGNRIIQVTGGTVNYSVFGGSNGYNSSEGDGTVNGSSFIYIGGTATIGNDEYQDQTLYGAESGSVFGIGNGRSGYSSIGSSDNSNIIVADKAVIKKNIYGGGNFGATGISSSSNTTTSTITVIGGTVEGAIFGGGNNNGSGSSSKTSTITINMTGGTVNNIYGGSNQEGTVYGPVIVNVTGGKVLGNIYGGGMGGYTSSDEPGTFVQRDVNVTIGSSEIDDLTIEGNVYGGSAFGTVNATSNTTTLSSYNTKVTVNNGTINGAVFGGGEGNDTYTPYVGGNVDVYINGGTINEVYGGNDASGMPNGTVKVYLNGGKVTTTYGGGNMTGVTTTNVYLQGGESTTIYGGSNQEGDVTTSNVTATSGTAGSIYGGNNAGGITDQANVTIDGGNITTVYGGGNLATTNDTKVLLNGATITTVYGGGESADITNATNITLQGSTVATIFGGSNQQGTVPTSNITTSKGTAATIYGGNNAGGITEVANITINGGTITTVYGGGKLATTNDTNVNLNASTVTTVYGGGESADITNKTNVFLNGTTIDTVFGGSNQKGTVTESNIQATKGSVKTIYGGNNIGGTTITTNILLNGSEVEKAVFGGGNEASSTTTNVTVEKTVNKIPYIYGGGNKADVTTTNVLLNKGDIGEVFGGSNESGTVTKSNVIAQGETAPDGANGVNVDVSYTATDSEDWQSTEYDTVATIKATLENTTTTTVNEWDISITSENSTIFSNYSNSEIKENNGVYTFDEVNRYYGTNSLGSYSVEFTILSHLPKDEFTLEYAFSGIGDDGTNYIADNKQYLTIDAIYGGNNAGGKTEETNVAVDGGTILEIYGGGNQAETGQTKVEVKTGKITNVYGGGNRAGVEQSTDVDILTSTISGNVFGGGNAGIVSQNTDLYVSDATISGSVYAGGNGATAIVYGNTLVNVDGTTEVTKHVFGGGNAAATGTEGVDTSQNVVNIAGATIGGNVYGGANTSILYGTVYLTIGHEAIGNDNLKKGDILIKGTVFGGGEANASGAENYDYSFISVTIGINIKIDATNHDAFAIKGSIFGSGNASSTTGYSYIDIINYGTREEIQKNISIQRANIVTLNNSVIALSGTTDRTNEYSDTIFSISRVDHLKLKNNSVLYLETGANLLQEFSSLLDENNQEVKQTVSIDDDTKTVTKNVDNRIYMYEGKNLNIALNQNVTSYGKVNGMAFFGMFTYDREGNMVTALYDDSYEYGNSATTNDLYYFNSGSYVLGLHKTNHDYEVDGFYSNEENSDELGTIKTYYVIPTPEDANYYMWVIGEYIESYEIDMTASKYSTLGTYELQLINYSQPNTRFSIVGFNYNDLNPEVSLVDYTTISRVASSHEIANNTMGLVMKSGSNLITVGSTNFLTSEQLYQGNSEYVSENTALSPSFMFYLYHSKNLSEAGSMGSVTISLLAVTPIDDLTNDVKRINIVVNMSRALYGTNEYEATMTPGKQYEMFATTLTKTTTKSSISAYFSLFQESDKTIYKTGYHRSLVSSYIFPENTKITMIDMLDGDSPKYYYYIVDASDVTLAQEEYDAYGEVSYNLSNFIAMGSISEGNNYDDASKNEIYYDESISIAQEEFIFIVDFSESNITEDVIDASLYIELRDADAQTIIGVLGIARANMIYSLYYDSDAIIDVDGYLNKDSLYVGEDLVLTVETDFIQQTEGSDNIYDTNYYDQKLGIKITILDSEGNVVNASSLLGISFVYEGEEYFPRTDGTVRFNLAERVANVSSKITIKTQNSNLASGDYTILVESFGSPDGIYYGLVSSDEVRIPLKVLNTIYGLSVSLNENSVIIDHETGKATNDNNSLVFNIKYQSGLENPNIRISLQRRDYSSIYTSVYHLVDLQDYTNTTLKKTNEEKIYKIIDSPLETNNYFLYLKPDLITGTYRVMFDLYDNDTYIGGVYQYIIIK